MRSTRVNILRNAAFALTTALMLPAMVACSDDTSSFDTPEGTLVIDLAIPQSAPMQTLAADGTMVSESVATSTPTADECRINDLRFIAFPQGKGNLVNEVMNIPDGGFGSAVSAEMRVNSITLGDYRIYIVANLGDKAAGVTTEQQLRDLIINWGSASSPALPQAGNLPMVYEPTGITTISDKTARLAATLEIACVKVSLNVIFDKNVSETAAAFGDKGMRITSVTASNVSASSTALKAEKVIEASYSAPITGGVHYSNYTRTDNNASLNDRDVIGNLSEASTPSDPSKRWCYHKVFYLPERYVTSDDAQTSLTIAGEIFGAGGNKGTANATNSYRIKLGHQVGSNRQLPRDTYYEIVAGVKSLGDIELESFTSIKQWSIVNLEASIVNTILSVDKTHASVTSLETDTVKYTSSVGNVVFNCGTPYIDNKPIIIAVHNAATKSFTLKVNPEISISKITDESLLDGTVKVSLKANNITKYIDVDYNIKPFFTVDYLDHTITWDPTLTDDGRTKIARVTTNLDGVKMPWASLPYTLVSGSANVRVNVVKSGEGQWDIKMTLPKDPVATTSFNFVVGPQVAKYYTSAYNKTITVTVKPQPNKYRIYMRAINDRQDASGAFQGIIAENNTPGSTANNDDGWGNNHRMYFYYQYGESGGTGEIPRSNVWIFSAKHWDNGNELHFYGDGMTADSQNPGWYYRDYLPDHQGEHIDNSKPKRNIVPGETLVIFHNNEDISNGYMRHRFTHHMDPGITLFDYEDREGWYLYDPTSDPYYRYYDDKPVIEDVDYVIYYKGTIQGWYNTYGVANADNTSIRYTIYSNSVSNTSAGNGWYKHTIRLKAPKGEYEKAIIIKFSSSVERVIFNGNSWKEGYYDGSWHKGKPSGVTL